MTKPKPAGSTRPTVHLTFPQRRILGTILDLIDEGTPAVTTSDVYTRLASQASAAPIAEATIRSHLDALTPELVTKVRPQIEITAAAWRSMNRNPAMAPSRKPSTPIEEAVIATPVPIAAPVVAPALREKPTAPIRRPSAPLALETRGPVRPMAAKLEDVQVQTAGAGAMLDALETRTPELLGILPETLGADVPHAAPEPIPPLVVPPLDKPTITFPRRDGETLVQLCRRYVEACGAQGTTADEAQEATGRDLGPTLSDLTSKGTLIGVGSGVGARSPSTPRRRWFLPQFVPSPGEMPEVVKPVAQAVAPVVAYDGASTLVVSPELIDPATAYGQRIAELERQYAELRTQHDKVTDELADIANALGFTGEARKLLDFAGEVAKERDEAVKARDAATTLHENWKRHIHSILGVNDDESVVGAWRKMTGSLNDAYEARDDLQKRLATALHFPSDSKLDDMLKEISALAHERDISKIGGDFGDVIDFTDEFSAIADALGFTGKPNELLDVARALAKDHADLSAAVDHTLHVLASNLPPDCCPVQGSPQSSTAADLVAMADAAANALASIPEAVPAVEPAPAVERADVADALLKAGDDLVDEIRRSVVADFARALNVQVEHADPGEAYFWLLDVARKRVPLDVGIDRMIEDELTKHEARMGALSVVYKLMKAAP